MCKYIYIVDDVVGQELTAILGEQKITILLIKFRKFAYMNNIKY